MSDPASGRSANLKLAALILVAGILVLTVVAVLGRSATTVTSGAANLGGASTIYTASTLSGQNSASTSSVTQTGVGEIGEIHFIAPCNCSYDLTWAWPTYESLADLKATSDFIVVGQVTSTRTVGVNVSGMLSQFYTVPENIGLIPVTGYNITVTSSLAGGFPTGDSLLVSQIGGSVGPTATSVSGYPTLSVGQSYVFFLASGGCVQGGTDELPTLYDSVYPEPAYFTYITVGGPQGLFTVTGGNVYSLDNTYQQADAWLPVKADGVPLIQFASEVQDAASASAFQSLTGSTSTSGYSTSTAVC